MKLENGFKLIYEKFSDNARKLFATKADIPATDDAVIDYGVDEEILKNIKLVYERNDELYISTTGIPSDNDTALTITANGELVIGGDTPVPPVPEALIPFSSNVPYYISEIIIDPTFATSEYMNDFLDFCKATGDSDITFVAQKEDKGTDYVLYQDVGGTDIFFVSGEAAQIIYTKNGVPGYFDIPGWVYCDIEAETFTPITARTSVTFGDDGALVDYFNEGKDSLFSKVNGVVVGYVEKKFSDLTPLKDGDKPIIVKFTNSLTDDQVTAIVSQLDYGHSEIPDTADLFNLTDGIESECVMRVQNMGDTYVICCYDIEEEGIIPVWASEDIIDPESGEILMLKGWNRNACTLQRTPIREVIGITGSIQPDIWNGYIVGIGENPEPPTPTTLTPFSVGQSISGVDFGSVENGDTNSDLDNFLLSDYPSTEAGTMLTWDAVGEFNLMRGKVKVDDNDVGLLIILLESAPIVVYATEAGTPEPGVTVTKGYQNLTDGKYMFSSLPAQTPKTIQDVNSDIEGWNGILVGAIEA